MARRTQLCALYRCFCHPSQGEHDGDDEGIIAPSCRRRRCQDEGRNGGPSSLRCRQGRAMAYRPRRVVAGREGEGASVSLSGRG